jgi:hypothetical protein
MHPSKKSEKIRPFWKRYLVLMSVDSGLVFSVSIIFLLFGGSNQISNLYFLSSIVFFTVASLPIFSEMGGNLRVAGRRFKGEDVDELAQSQAERSKAGMQITYLYGLAGISAIILALVFVSYG